MSRIRPHFGPVGNFEITLNGLNPGSARSSALVANHESRYIDAVCQFAIKPAGGSFGDRYAVFFFAWGAADENAPVFPAGITGVDQPLSVALETLSLRPIGSLYLVGSGVQVTPPMSVAPAFGNVLPPVWGVLVVNRCNVALDATENTAIWRGVEFEVS